MNPMVGNVCVGIGALAGLIGFVFGIVFMLDTEFVVAHLSCNVTDADDPDASEPFCNEDNLLEVNDSVCRVGNLGPFTSQFTPRCADNTPYAIPTIIDEFDGDTLNFGPLFAAQTDLAGALPDLLGTGEDTAIEFENCEQFFAEDDLETAMAAAAVLATDGELDTLREAVKDFFDETLEETFTTTDGLFANIGIVVKNAVSDTLNTSLFIGTYGAIPDLTATPYGGAGSLIAFSAAFGFTLVPGTAFAFTSLDSLVTLGDANFVSPFTDIIVRNGATIGTEFDPELIPGVSDEGFWDIFGSTALCPTVLGASAVFTKCTYAKTLRALTELSSDPALADLISLLDGYLADAEDGTKAAWTQFTSETDVDATYAGFGSFAFENFVEDIVLMAKNESLDNTLYQAESDPAEYETKIQTAKLIVAGGFNKAIILENLQGSLTAEDVIPENIGAPAEDTTGSLALLCGGLGLLQNCSFLEAIAAVDPADFGDLATDVLIVQSLFAGCSGLQMLATGSSDLSAFTLSECLALFVPIVSPGADNSVVDQTTFALLDAFYDVGAEGLTTAEYFEAAVSECEDDEKDRAALALAQQLVPAGTALLGVAIILAVLNAVLRTKYSRIFGGVFGLLAFIGAILPLVGLLAVYNAPVYGAVGASSGPIEDGATLYSTGRGTTFAFATIGASLVGAIFLLIGGVLIAPPEDMAKDILKA